MLWCWVDRVFGPQTNTQDVYEVAAQPVVKAAMEGIHGIFSWDWTVIIYVWHTVLSDLIALIC